MAAGPKTIAFELSTRAWAALGQDPVNPARCTIQNVQAAKDFSTSLSLALQSAPGMDRLTSGLWNSLHEMNLTLTALLSSEEKESLVWAASILGAIRNLLDDLVESAPSGTAEELARKGFFVGFGQVTYPLEAAQ